MARRRPAYRPPRHEDADTNDGSCDALDCSLREAVIAANATAEAEVIVVPADYALTCTAGRGRGGHRRSRHHGRRRHQRRGAASVSAAGLGDRVFQVLAQAGE